MTRRGAGRPARVVLVLALALLVTVSFAGTASAHATLIGSDPADGATLSTAPTTVTLTFDDSLENFEPVVSVTGPDGSQFQAGEATIDGATLSSRVLPLTAPGTYTIAYRVVSDDGHPVEGQVRFDLAVPPPVDPASTSAPVTSAPVTSAPVTSAPVTSSSGTSPAPASSASASSPAAATVTSGADTAAAASSSGWSTWLWLGVAVLLLLAFGVSMIVRRRLAARAGARSDDSTGADG